MIVAPVLCGCHLKWGRQVDKVDGAFVEAREHRISSVAFWGGVDRLWRATGGVCLRCVARIRLNFSYEPSGQPWLLFLPSISPLPSVHVCVSHGAVKQCRCV